MSTIRARFDGKVLIPIEPVNLPTDRTLELDVREAHGASIGSPALLLKLMREDPHVPVEDVNALEQAIAEGGLPSVGEGIFDDLIEDEQR